MKRFEQQLSQLLSCGDFEAAQQVAGALEISTLDNVKILMLGAVVFRRLGDLDKASKFSCRAASIDTENRFTVIEYSNDLIKLGLLDEAESVLKSIPEVQGRDKHLLLHRSKILYQRKEFQSAVKLLVGLVKSYPEFAPAHMELAHSLLMHGKWPAGWQEYEWRFRLPKTKDMFPKFKMPHWDGSKGLPHILLIADQGYGDCFQFSRYIPLVAQCCNQVTIIRSQPLARLIDAIPSVSSSHMNWEDTPHTSAYCTLSGLPRLFSTKPDSIPDCAGVIKAEKNDVFRWQKRLKQAAGSAALKVGVVWSGRVEFEGNYLRAVPFKDLKVLFDLPGIEFFSLQVGSPAHQALNSNITDLSEGLTDFAETAAAMEALDLIITSDTSVAHLAGSLNVPTWVLLHYAPDWRWGSQGTTSPWYPSTRLFRQNEERNWVSVVNEVKGRLNEITYSNSPLAALSLFMSQSAVDLLDPYI